MKLTESQKNNLASIRAKQILAIAAGVAFCRFGLEFFNTIMPIERAASLYRGYKEVNGVNWVNGNFMNQIISIAGREERKIRNSKHPDPVDNTNNEIPPECSNECGWKQPYGDNSLQCNALRVESLCVEKQRCGWNLKPGYTGGYPLDYAPCTFH